MSNNINTDDKSGVKNGRHSLSKILIILAVTSIIVGVGLLSSDCHPDAQVAAGNAFLIMGSVFLTGAFIIKSLKQ